MLAPILILFIMKGIFLALTLPFFQGPDEALHFAQMERWAEPKLPTWPITTDEEYVITSEDIRTYHFPEEVIQTGYLTQFDQVKFQKENRQLFTNATTGQNEGLILEGNWKQYLDVYPPTTSNTWSLYYFFGSKIENIFTEESVFFRFFAIRLFSLILGVGIIILSYLTARKAGFNSYVAVLFTTLVTFQPMLSQTATIINYDISIIFSFSLFLYAGVSLMKDIYWKYAFLLLFSAIIGFFSKGPGIVLVVTLYPLLAWCSYQKLNYTPKRFLTLLTGMSILLAGIAFLVIPKNYFVSITNLTAQSQFSSPMESIGQYLGATMDSGELRDTVRSYWGHFGWLDHAIPEWMLSVIILITLVGFIGTLWHLFSQKKFEYLPAKKYLVFFLGMIILLQVAIRFYDWRVFDATGQILIGQPGRYFLPNIIAHLLIVITGIGFLLRRENRFVLAMQILTLAMILLQLHAIVNVIVPRYYL
jgi:hypothetical protein